MLVHLHNTCDTRRAWRQTHIVLVNVAKELIVPPVVPCYKETQKNYTIEHTEYGAGAQWCYVSTANQARD